MESLIEKFDKECNCSDNIESVLAQIRQPKKNTKFLIQLMNENHSNPIRGFPIHTVERAEMTLFRTCHTCLAG